MPHSSRNKKKRPAHQKRVQIDDDEGWTHITRTGKTPTKRVSHLSEDILVAAEAPEELTLDGLKKQYESYKRRWEESHTWRAVREALNDELSRTGSKIDNCVCVGLGSPSGLLRRGWVDRRAVSLYQLAALKTTLEYISQNSTQLATIKDCYAQDPVFNTLDIQLLETLDIHVVQDPEAFALINEGTFLYCPGAERTHLLRMLPANPALFFGGPLEGGNSVQLPDEEEKLIRAFLDNRRSMCLPPFEPNEHAFWKTGLFWKFDTS